MDNTQLINLLTAASSSGELAEEIRQQVREQFDALMGDGEFEEAFIRAVEAFLDVTVEEAVKLIIITEGADTVVASFLGSAFGSGLGLGIAMAVKAAEG